MKQVNRHKPNPLSHPTGPTMRINGQTVSRIVARYAYRCAECLGDLKYRGAGLACVTDENHRGFVTKVEAAKEAVKRSNELAELTRINTEREVFLRWLLKA